MFKKLALIVSTVTILLSGCGEKQEKNTNAVAEQQTFKWKLVTTWPKNFPGLGEAPEEFAKHINKMSNGRLTVQVFGAGQLVPGFEVFDTVKAGTAQMGHGAAYYWTGKMNAAPFFTAVPFGMNMTETNAWLYYGGGMELWQKLYKPFGLVPFPGGNSGAQFAGWFNKEINSVDDLQGLKMRIGGLGGEVFNRAGGLPVQLPGGEIFSSLQSGVIDATEWVGPHNDLAFGFYKTTKYYYSTVWQEPSATLEFIINEQALNELPDDLREMVVIAMRAVNDDMINKYTARSPSALITLVEKHDVQVKQFPNDVIEKLKATTAEVINEKAANDPVVKEIWDSYKAFYDQVRAYHKVTDHTYFENRQ